MAQHPFSMADQPSARGYITDNYRRAGDLVLSNVGIGMSLPASTSNGTEPFVAGLQTSGLHGRATSTDTLMGPPGQNLSHSWFRGSEPWSHIAATNPSPSPTVPGFESRASKTPFRSHAASDCGTGPLDSAYGTMSRADPSIANVSIYGDCDRSGETASVASHPASFFHDQSFAMLDAYRRPDSVIGTHSRANPSSKGLICLYCKNTVKTPSELKKHKQRHEKPFHCPIADCSRTVGFSTSNDLDRHVRSRHPDADPKAVFYRCPIEDCRSADKKWPRADNFRQHLKRVHQRELTMDDELLGYIYKPRPPAGSELAGLGSAVGEISMDISRRNSTLGPSSWDLDLPATQNQGARDSSSNGDFVDQRLFQTSTMIDQQANASDAMDIDQDSSAGIQMQSAKFDMETDLSQLGECHIELQGRPGPTDSASVERNMEFQSPFFADASIPGNDSISEEGDRSDTETNMEMVILDDQCEMPAPLVQLQQDITEPNDTLTILDPLKDECTESDDVESLSTSSKPTEGSEGSSVSPEMLGHQIMYPRISNELHDQLLNVDDKNRTSDLLNLLSDKHTLRALLRKIDDTTLAETLASLGYKKSEEPMAKSDSHSGFSTTGEAGKSYNYCPSKGCEKRFARPCELRKHIKRHDKPYGCTFAGCDKKFGSKNDWKRHENSQHFQLEQWKCNEPSLDDVGRACGKTYNRRELFKAHLSREHSILEPKPTALKPEHRLDTNNGKDFWCGFCKASIEVQKGSEFWAARCDHIDKHFTDQLDISQWERVGTRGVEASAVSARRSQADQEECADTLAAAARLDSTDQLLKRHTDREVQQARASKRPRATEVWYCCGCSEQVLLSFSSFCLTPRCRGHERCGNCTGDRVLLHPEA